MPLTVFVVGVLLGTEKYALMYALNMLLVGFGIGLASYGGYPRFCQPGCGGVLVGYQQQ